MTDALLSAIPTHGPVGLELVEDGPFGIDLVRPSGVPFNGVTSMELEQHGFVSGWIRCWGEGLPGASCYAYLLASPSAAAACTADQAARFLTGDRVFEVAASPLGSTYQVFAREIENVALCWAVTTIASVTLWLETRAATPGEAMRLLEALASSLSEPHVVPTT